MEKNKDRFLPVNALLRAAASHLLFTMFCLDLAL